MCGIAGIFDPKAQTAREELTDLARSIAAALRHRGPDDDGVWVDETAGIGLGHCRLSIIDLSPTGRQPMVSPAGRYVLTYNGEIYNYRDLRDDLEKRGARFRGSSDTEVLAAGLDEWGLEATLGRLDGMFAFGAWDREQRRLLLARDRFGEKPLYWGRVDGRLLFASELRAAAAVTATCDVDPAAVADVLAYKCVQGSRTIYRQFQKLPPGHYAVADGRSAPIVECYWSATEAALEARSRPLDIDEVQAVAELSRRLRDTVASRMVADVPVGAFLSAGVDSAAVTAFMVRVAPGPVRTFTVGLDDQRFDESTGAQAVAQRLGTEHHPLRVTATDVMDLVPKIPAVYDEPFADSSQLPTLLLSTLAVGEVKVALTGDGGDEVFGGYNRHVYGDRLLRVSHLLPRPVRVRLGERLEGMRPGRIQDWSERLYPFLPARLRVRLPADKVRKVGRFLTASRPQDAYLSLVADAASADLSSNPVQPPPASRAVWGPEGRDLPFSQRAMLADVATYLPNDILVKVDRAAMSVSLETRAPYLDHRLFGWAWRLPPRMRVDSGVGKRVLRAVVDEQVGGFDPLAVKSGFGVPIGEWLRGPLRPWADDLLNIRDEHIQRDTLEGLWRDHLTGRSDHTHVLWSVLMLRSWLDRNGTGSSFDRATA